MTSVEHHDQNFNWVIQNPERALKNFEGGCAISLMFLAGGVVGIAVTLLFASSPIFGLAMSASAIGLAGINGYDACKYSVDDKLYAIIDHALAHGETKRAITFSKKQFTLSPSHLRTAIQNRDEGYIKYYLQNGGDFSMDEIHRLVGAKMYSALSGYFSLGHQETRNLLRAYPNDYHLIETFVRYGKLEQVDWQTLFDHTDLPSELKKLIRDAYVANLKILPVEMWPYLMTFAQKIEFLKRSTYFNQQILTDVLKLNEPALIAAFLNNKHSQMNADDALKLASQFSGNRDIVKALESRYNVRIIVDTKGNVAEIKNSFGSSNIIK